MVVMVMASWTIIIIIKIETMTTEDMTIGDMIEIKIKIDQVGKDQEVKRQIKILRKR
jgi:hypothetical protein